MRLRIASGLLGLALAVSSSAAALAQADDTGTPVETSVDAAGGEQSLAAPALFLSVTDPVEQDVEVALDIDRVSIVGTSLPGTVVSVGDDLVDVDDQGNFAASVALEEGANEIDVVASDGQGNQVSTTLFVVRGE